MSQTVDCGDLFELITSLWQRPPDESLMDVLPRDAGSLRDFYPRLRRYVDNVPTLHQGRIDSAAIVQGEIRSMGEGSVIEAGAIIHESCRLVLGPRSRVRPGAVLRDEVVIGPDCMIGTFCEVARSVILGPRTYLGHFNYVGDSILGRDCVVSGNVMVANTMIKTGRSVHISYRGRKIDSGRSYMGVLAGDGVRFGGSITICPGCVVLPNLSLPPRVVLYGVIDSQRRDRLMAEFFKRWGDEGGS